MSGKRKVSKAPPAKERKPKGFGKPVNREREKLIARLMKQGNARAAGDLELWDLLAQECAAIEDQRKRGFNIDGWQEGLDKLQRAYLPFRAKSIDDFDDFDRFSGLDHAAVKEAGAMIWKVEGFEGMLRALEIWMPHECGSLTEKLWDGIGDWKA